MAARWGKRLEKRGNVLDFKLLINQDRPSCGGTPVAATGSLLPPQIWRHWIGAPIKNLNLKKRATMSASPPNQIMTRTYNSHNPFRREKCHDMTTRPGALSSFSPRTVLEYSRVWLFSPNQLKTPLLSLVLFSLLHLAFAICTSGRDKVSYKAGFILRVNLN